MKKLIVFVVLLTLAVMGSLLWAQGGAPGGGGGGGGFGKMPPTPKQLLGQTFRAIGKLEKKPIAKDQASKILAVVGPWRAKPKMSDDEAKEVGKKLKPAFTVDQLNEIDTMRDAGRGGFGGGGKGGPGGGGPGGPGKGSGGGTDEATKAKMMEYGQKRREITKDDNPLNIKLAESRLKEGQAEFKKAFPEQAKSGGNRGAARGQQRLEELKKAWSVLDGAAKSGAPAKADGGKKADAKKDAAKKPKA